MDITRYDSVQLSKDDDRYPEKLAALNEAGFWHDPVQDRWIKPEPLLEEDEVRLQFFGSEGVYLARDTINFRKMLGFLMEAGFKYDEQSDRWFRQGWNTRR